MPLLEGRIAVVTGAGRGIGYEIAGALVENGAKVVIGDVNGDLAAAAAVKLGGPEAVLGRQHCPCPSLSPAATSRRA